MNNFMDENFKRANIEKIVEFILYGDDSNAECDNSKSLEEKFYLAEQKQNDFFRSLIPGDEAFLKMNDLLSDFMECYFALGVKAGAKICVDLLR
jgi:hypothetical protein